MQSFSQVYEVKRDNKVIRIASQLQAVTWSRLQLKMDNSQFLNLVSFLCNNICYFWVAFSYW